MKPERALVINGAVGAGKTTIAYAVAEILGERGNPGAMIDLDALSQCWPSTPGDPFSNRIMHRNLASVVTNYLADGKTTFVLPGVVETAAERAEFTDSVGIAPVVVRLTAPVPVLQERVRGREAVDHHQQWHVGRAAELTSILDSAAVDDHLITNDGVTPHEVAAKLLDTIGWS